MTGAKRTILLTVAGGLLTLTLWSVLVKPLIEGRQNENS